MLNMSTFFKVQMGQNRVITGVSAVDSTVRVGKRLISVKTIGFYIVSPVGKVIINAPHFPIPRFITQFEITMSPSSERKMPVKAAAPNNIINTMAEVFAVSNRDALSISILNCL